MRRISWLLCLGSLVAVSNSVGQSAQPPLGLLSLIESDPREGAQAEGPGRGPLPVLPRSGVPTAPPRHAFVEVVHLPRWQACAATNRNRRFDDSRCQQFEWSVPFMTEASSEQLEEALSRAWNTFDARTAWRMNSLVNSLPDEALFPRGYSRAKNCAGPQVDRFIDAWNRRSDGRIDPVLFCSNWQPATTPAFRRGLCRDLERNTNWGEVNRRQTRALSYALSTYYPQYWEAVYEAVRTYMPLALKWDGLAPLVGRPVGTVGGVVMQPVYRDLPNPTQYQLLAAQAKALDPRGDVYVLQNYPGMSFPREVRDLVFRRGPGAQANATWPGIPRLERLKTGLAKREDIFETRWKWANIQDARPRGERGTATLEEFQGVGHVIFLQAFSRVDQEDSPREILFQRTCYRSERDRREGRLTLAPPVRLPNPIYTLSRAHTRWISVPEGYDIPNVVNLPKLMMPGDSPAPDGVSLR